MHDETLVIWGGEFGRSSSLLSLPSPSTLNTEGAGGAPLEVGSRPFEGLPKLPGLVGLVTSPQPSAPGAISPPR